MCLLVLLCLTALAGCGRPELPSAKMARQIREWIPPKTDVATARRIMEQHQFVCTVESFDSKAAMPKDYDVVFWNTGIFRDGRSQALTNLSILNCESTNHGGMQTKQYRARLTFLNGLSDGPRTVSAW